MRWHRRSRREREDGAVLVEFALVMPLLLLLLWGLAEFGRYVAVYTAVNTASREAARFGSAASNSVNGIPRYTDCAEIRNEARDLVVIITLADSDITVDYDNGPGTATFLSCPVGMTADPALLSSGDRIVTSVSATFDSTLPLIGDFIGPVTITSTNRRTIFKG